eukprot:g16101.t1
MSRRSPHWTAESFFDAQASRSSQTWKSASSAEKSPKSAGPKRVAASTKAPSTPEEVGHWLSSHDALQSVKGDPLKSSCGWSSGFRRDPMSTDSAGGRGRGGDVRIMERSNAAFAKRRKDERSSWAVRFAAAEMGRWGGLQDPTGESTWPPAVVLMAHLASSRGRALLHGKDVLELGAGNGALAKAVAVNAQPRKLVATDLPHRVEENKSLMALHWGDAAAVAQLCREHFGRPHAQVVLISDCLYTNWVEDSAHLLAKTLHAALASESIALLAYLPRSGPLEAHFFECVQHVYGLQTLPKPLPDYYLLKAMDEAREFQEEELRAVRLFEISVQILSKARKHVAGLPELRFPAMEPEFLEVEVNGLAGHLCHLHLNRRQRLSEHCSIAAVEQRLFLNSTELFSTEQLLNSSGRELTLVRRSSLQVQWLQEVSKNGKAFAEAPLETAQAAELIHDSQETIFEALQQDWRLLQYVPEDLREQIDIIEAALQQGGSVSRVVPEHRRGDARLAQAAVKLDGSALRYFDAEVMEDKDLVMKAVKQYPDALEFIPKHFLKDPDAGLRMRRRVSAVKDVIRCAVESDGTCLSYAHEDLRGDVDLVFAAVQQEGMALEYASEELQADRRLVLAALRADGSALQFAGDALREDEEVVYAALRSDGLALEFAHPSKRSDKELVLFAIRKERPWRLETPAGSD